MINVYKYLFYKIYVFTKKLGNHDVAYSAVLGMSGILMLNAFIFLIKLFDVNEHIFASIKPILFVLGCMVILINFFIFVYKDKYLSIIKQFEKESEKSRIFGNIIVTIWVVLTFGFILFG